MTDASGRATAAATPAQVISQAQILGIRLIDGHCGWDPSLKPRGGSRPAVQIEVEGSAFRHDEQNFSVLAQASLAVPAEDDPEPWARITAAFELIYQLPEGAAATDEELTAFAEVNGIFNAWPFFREYIHNASARMGLPPLVIPLFRVPQQTASRPAKSSSRPRAEPKAKKQATGASKAATSKGKGKARSKSS